MTDRLPQQDFDFGGTHTIKNAANPTNAQDYATKDYVDGVVSGDVAGDTHAATSKATPVDNDEIPLADSATSYSLKKLLWSNLKATLKTYFDTLYPSGSGTSSGTNTGDQTSVSGNAGTATALQTGRTIDGQNFDGTANITVIAPGTHAATSKATPVDADELALVDSAASNVLKKLTWANLKATLKTYFDTLYTAAGASAPPNGSAGGDLGGTYPNPTVAALHETTGPTKLTLGSIPDGDYLVRSGATIIGGTPTPGGPPTGAAGGVLDGTYPNPGLAASVAGDGLAETSDVLSVNVDGSTIEISSDAIRVKDGGITSAKIANGTITPADIADPTTGKVIGSSGSAAAAVYPPGYELGYAEITTPKNITDTNEATATALITLPAITFDGAPVIIEVFAIVQCSTAAASNTVGLTLFEGSTEITQLAVIRSLVTTTANIETVRAAYRFTPSAGSHTYKLCGVVVSTTGTPQLLAGAGGTAAKPPAFIRAIKV